jgi:hypothetical protein
MKTKTQIKSKSRPNRLAMGEVVSRYYQWLWDREQYLQKAHAAGRGKPIAVVKV